MEWAILVVFFCIFGVLYFLPTIVAAKRNHPQARAIFVLNLLTGLTAIGWVAAFVWAFISPHSGPVVVTHQMPMPPQPRRIEPANWEADKELPAWLRQ